MTTTNNDTARRMAQLKICVVIPTYNNDRTLAAVVESVGEYCRDIIVVNDGATDSTHEIIRSFGEAIDRVEYSPNRGKGYALSQGIRRAAERGFDYMITLDSDGQHFAADLPLFVDQIEKHPGSMIIGSRFLDGENIPSRNRFANRFSNFWFAVQTFKRLPDTQTGYRLYPIDRMRRMKPLTSRYEAELELLVRAAWRNIELRPIKIDVYYAPEGERVSHFRRGRDFIRISLLNTLLCFAALLYGYESMIVRKTAKLFAR